MSTDDEREPAGDLFHPLGEAAETNFRELLEETEYDADLGMAMAEDAMRVTKGELSEAEFHERYHEDVLAEFGEDERPTKEAYENAKAEATGTLSGMLDRVSGGDGDDSRRDAMKKMGAGAAAVGLGAWGVTDGGAGADPEALAAQEDDEGEAPADGETGDGVQWGMALDLDVCDGCLSCVVACNQEHNWDEGANWMYILAYEDGVVESPDGDDFESTRDFNYLIRPCQHCTDAPCEKVCPTTARHTRDEGGLVLTDYDVCIGCRYCQVACPYGVNYFQWGEPEVDAPSEELGEEMMFDQRDRWVSGRGPRGVMEKCIFDPARQDGNMGEEMVGTTACEDACPPGAIQFGDMNDPESDPQRYVENVPLARALEADPDEEELQEAITVVEEGEDGDLTVEEAERLLRGEYGEPDSSFRLLQEFNTDPNVLYLGNEPGPDAEQVPGPVAYDDVGQVDNRKNVLDDRTVDEGLDGLSL
jgi:Fe-S-cluster-containing dehydrogenase component